MTRRHKWGNVITERDGMKFHSKKEAEYYDILKTAQAGGYVSFFLRQVPFHLPGNVKYICDFLVFYTDGTAQVIDIKGKRTPAYIKNKKMVEALFPVTIEER